MGVGLFFSLGHSTIVVALTVAIAVATTDFAGSFRAFRSFGGVIGTLVSALFLFAIAIANIIVLVSVWRTFQTVKSGGRLVEDDLDLMLANRGLLGRLFRRFFRLIERSWQMYPLGVLFGLASTRRPRWACSASPPASLAGPFDLVDPGLSRPVHRRHDPARYDRQHPHARRLWLGLHQADPQALLQSHHHAVSVLVALIVGGLEALNLIGDRLGLTEGGGFWGAIGSLNDNFGMLGYLIVGVFVPPGRSRMSFIGSRATTRSRSRRASRWPGQASGEPSQIVRDQGLKPGVGNKRNPSKR